jgi:hypothetical protein
LVDAKRGAPLLGLLPVELQLKAHYPIPEIWLRLDDRPAAEQAARALREAGLSARVSTAADFAGIPAQREAESCTFGDNGLTLALAEEDIVLPYDVPVTIVACSPRDAADDTGRALGERGSGGLHTVDADGSGAWGVFADVYIDAPPKGVLRIGVIPARTEFTDLVGMGMSGLAGRLARFVSECESRFKRLLIDRRLLHLHTRGRHAPPPGVQRKGFAFGTPALQALLEDIAPADADMSQCELGSRLVYLTQR